MEKGVFEAKKKDGTRYYRSSITYQNKHISLGSFPDEKTASLCYQTAGELLSNHTLSLSDYQNESPLSFSKWVVLINFRDNHIYIKTPIYLYRHYFRYYFSFDDFYIFDIDDLFYFSTRTISRRGGHLFVADYGMQVNVLSRYGIKNYGVPGKDFEFMNGNERDFRYANIKIINRFQGVCQKEKGNATYYEAKIHWNGNFLIGRYQTEIEAAIAYNKAASILIKKGYIKNYPVNYIESLSSEEYRRIFKQITISDTIRNLTVRQEHR